MSKKKKGSGLFFLWQKTSSFAQAPAAVAAWTACLAIKSGGDELSGAAVVFHPPYNFKQRVFCRIRFPCFGFKCFEPGQAVVFRSEDFARAGQGVAACRFDVLQRREKRVREIHQISLPDIVFWRYCHISAHHQPWRRMRLEPGTTGKLFAFRLIGSNQSALAPGPAEKVKHFFGIALVHGPHDQCAVYAYAVEARP